jgi:1,2-phenylacetyl-CoA epoxidase catalytic subunit
MKMSRSSMSREVDSGERMHGAADEAIERIWWTNLAFLGMKKDEVTWLDR